MTKVTKVREIWVYGDLRDERLFGLSLRVLAKARGLAGACSGKAAMVLLGSSVPPQKETSSCFKDALGLKEASNRSVSHGAGASESGSEPQGRSGTIRCVSVKRGWVCTIVTAGIPAE